MNTTELFVTYADKVGSIEAVAHSTGEWISIELDGVTFEDRSFDALSPVDGTQAEALSRFSLGNAGVICECEFQVRFPTLVSREDEKREIEIRATIAIGPQVPHSYDYPDFTLNLSCEVAGAHYETTSSSDAFDRHLDELQMRLGEWRIHNCFFCKYASYASRWGHESHGCMGCFRNMKEKIKGATGYDEVNQLFADRRADVQETWICGDFERNTYIARQSVFDRINAALEWVSPGEDLVLLVMDQYEKGTYWQELYHCLDQLRLQREHDEDEREYNAILDTMDYLVTW